MVADVPLSYFLLVLRICVFPVLGYFAHCLVYRWDGDAKQRFFCSFQLIA